MTRWLIPRQLQGILPLAGWHAHSLPAFWRAGAGVGMLGAGGGSMPSKRRAGHATPVTDTVRWLILAVAAAALAAGCGSAASRAPEGPPPEALAAARFDPYAALVEAMRSGQPPLQAAAAEEIGRASCRERV